LYVFSAVIACIFLVKLLVVFQLSDHPLLHPDSGLDTTAYAGLARRILNGDLGLGPGLYFVSPLYAYFLAAVLYATDSFTAARVVQVGLGTASVACLWATAREWFGRRAAAIAAGLAAATALFTFYEVLILQASIDAFLTSAALLALTRGLIRQSPRMLGIAGLVFGIASLNRPNMMIAATGVTVVMLAARRWRPAALLAAGVAIGLAPVAVRNVVVSGQWSLVSSHGGLNFLIGNGEGATGFYRALPGITPNIAGQQRDARRVASRALGRPVTDAEASDYFFDQAWGWIQSHPTDALALFSKKLAWVFHAQHIALPHSFPFFADEAPLLRALVVGPWLLIPLGLVGLVAAAPPRDRASYLIWLSFVPAYAISVALFFVAERYRLPLLVPLSIGAGAAVDAIVRAVRAGRTASWVAALLACIAIGVAANWHLGLDDGRSQEGVRMAERLVIIEKYDEAEQWVRRLAPVVPHPSNLHYVVGVQYLAHGEHARAVDHLMHARQLDAGDAEIAAALGQSLLAAGRPAEAVAHLRHAFDRGATGLPGLPLAEALQQTGDPAGAIDVLRRTTPGEEAPADAWLRLGRLAAILNAPEVAEPFFRRAAQMQPDAAAARLQYGLTLLALRRLDDAARELGEAVRLDPTDPDALVQLAYVDYLRGRLDSARALTARALSIAPTHPLGRQLAEALR
jgi:Flp pilus assembly protein TadD/4-amino-4-deoxy-L-arabinose transferase-like glycosyltransferase